MKKKTREREKKQLTNYNGHRFTELLGNRFKRRQGNIINKNYIVLNLRFYKLENYYTWQEPCFFFFLNNKHTFTEQRIVIFCHARIVMQCCLF